MIFSASMAITDSLTLRGAHLNGDYQLAEMHMHWGNNNSIGSEHALDSKKRPAEVWRSAIYIVSFSIHEFSRSTTLLKEYS